MSMKTRGVMSRRNFMKLSAAAAAATTVGGSSRVLYALVTGKESAESRAIRNQFSACDMCFNKCGLIARVENGVVKKLDPNPKSLKSRGMLCARGNAGVKQLYDPDRLKYPLLRKGKRGEGKWQRLSWDQALDHAADPAPADIPMVDDELEGQATGRAARAAMTDPVGLVAPQMPVEGDVHPLDLGQERRRGGRRTLAIEQDRIAPLHRAKAVAGLEIAHPSPCGRALFNEITPGVVLRFLLHQPVIHNARDTTRRHRPQMI